MKVANIWTREDIDPSSLEITGLADGQTPHEMTDRQEDYSKEH